MNKGLRILSTAALFSGAVYLVWLGVYVRGPLGYVYLIAECLMASLVGLFVFNHWSQKHTGAATTSTIVGDCNYCAIASRSTAEQGVYAAKKHHQPMNHERVGWGGGVVGLDVWLPVVNEPLEMFERTLRAALAIEWGETSIYVLDDGPRDEVKRLAQEHGVKYLTRPDRRDAKAGNMNHALRNSVGRFILVLDADQVVEPQIAQELIGHFVGDDRLALVATRQRFDVSKGDFNRDLVFYDQMQPGKNADNAAISCGSGVIYRREAIEAISGFATWNLVEDLTTSFELHVAGWRSLYVNKSYTIGTAPSDLPTIYKQRGTWALDSLRLIAPWSRFWRSPLTIRQRLHFLELGWVYVVSAVATPMLLVTLVADIGWDVHLLAGNQQGVWFTVDAEYLSLRGLSLLFALGLFWVADGRRLSSSRWWSALWPVYLWALLLLISGRRRPYRVTAKIPSKGLRGWLCTTPHLIILAALLAGWIVGTVFSPPLESLHKSVLQAVLIVCLAYGWWPLLIRGIGFSYSATADTTLVNQNTWIDPGGVSPEAIR